MKNKKGPGAVLLATAATVLLHVIPAPACSADNAVAIEKAGDVIRVTIGGDTFTAYHYRDVDRPFFYPVIGPTGVNVTRHWPMKDGTDEQHDHRHHHSLWFTHGDVNGHDFWSHGRGPKIVQDGPAEIESKDGVAVLKCKNKWLAKDGKPVCTDERVHRFSTCGKCRIIDFAITVSACDGKVVFGDTKEGSMAIRLAPTMRLKGTVGTGHIVNSAGDRDNKTWGKRAAWCDYYGPLEGKTVGVAIFDHPDNPRHPTWWHVRNYGLFAANPFGIHYFEKKKKGAGDLTVPAGKSVTFRYRFYFHEGDEKEGRVAAMYKKYASAQ